MQNIKIAQNIKISLRLSTVVIASRKGRSDHLRPQFRIIVLDERDFWYWGICSVVYHMRNLVLLGEIGYNGYANLWGGKKVFYGQYEKANILG